MLCDGMQRNVMEAMPARIQIIAFRQFRHAERRAKCALSYGSNANFFSTGFRRSLSDCRTQGYVGRNRHLMSSAAWVRFGHGLGF
jgi:hypothetical protein